MVNNTGLSLVQGRTAVVLTTNQLAAQTNGRSRADITYTVITPPHHGRIAINDQEVTTFCHVDLQFGRVVYHMTDLSESEDSFQISVSASSPGVDYGHLTTETVRVTVRPLVYLREPVRVPSGVAVKLGKAMIDASELARISRTDPVFEVLSPPKHGKLVKVKLLIVLLRHHLKGHAGLGLEEVFEVSTCRTIKLVLSSHVQTQKVFKSAHTVHVCGKPKHLTRLLNTYVHYNMLWEIKKIACEADSIQILDVDLPTLSSITT